MTEGKRFKFARTNDNGWVVLDEGNILWKDEILHLLNELHEENEKLTKQLVDFKILVNDLSIQRDEFFNGAIENAELNGKLQKENEQLRLQMLRLYNYFEDNLKEEMNPTVFSEMWDIVKRELKSYMGD